MAIFSPYPLDLFGLQMFHQEKHSVNEYEPASILKI